MARFPFYSKLSFDVLTAGFFAACSNFFLTESIYPVWAGFEWKKMHRQEDVSFLLSF